MRFKILVTSRIYHQLFIIILLLRNCVSGQIDWAEDDDDPVSTVSVEAVLGRTATLPCDIDPGPEARDDRVYMVLWFRESAGKPLYSFDVRGRAFSKALYWSDTNAFGPRAYFLTVSKPATLSVDNVQLDDEGVYRCRVDFQNSPTRNHRINLTVIVPPHQILVYDASGRDVAGSVGPLLEDNNLVLTCEVRGGRPEPTVTWYSGMTPLQTGGGVSMGRHVTVNRLEISHVKRDALNTTYVCQASNTKLVPPAERTVRVEMLLKPISTSIVHKPKQLVTESQITLSCEVEGSVPDTEIKWTQNNRVFERGTITNTTNGSVVISTLTFLPVPSDDNTKLKCEGSNPRLPNSALEDTLIMNVLYPPEVTLTLGSTLNPDDIKENDDVYFECNVKANPSTVRISWSHDGIPVTQNVSWGVIISTRSLVLQRVGRNHSGMYACSAANDRGETQSSLVSLRVHYAPVCISSSVTIVGASIDESVTIACRISADPPKVSFEWTFSNSGERYEVPSGHYTTIQQNFNADTDHIYLDADENGTNGNGLIMETVNELIYTPKGERDYGTLACWGTNSIGKQVEPCLFQIVPAAKPAPLRNCTLRPYSSPSSISAATSMLSNSSSSNLPFYSGGNQIVNGGQHLKELNYITTEYVKDRNLVDDKRKSSSNIYHHQHQQQQHHQFTSLERKNNNGKNMSLSSTQRYNTVQQQQQQQQYQQQHRNNTNNINFSDNKSNDRYKSNLKNIKRHTTSSSLPSSTSHESGVTMALRNENKREVGGNRLYSSSFNETRHVNFNKRASAAQKNNQYSTDSVDTSISYLRSSSSISSSSKYHHVPSAINSHVEQPTLMELECIAGFDGGLPQYFFLEAYDSRTRKLRLNITSALNDVPLFRIDLADLLPSDSYTPTLHLVAYSVNQKGRSEPTVLEDIAINEAEKRTDSGDESGLFPVAALFTGALLTIGLAVLLIVFIALRKNREQVQTHDNGIKEKHIGMDITVTTPLEMNVGQQKYVVAYTLKQGTEKQPDILNAQKSQDSVDSVHKMGSPAAIKPDGLFSATLSSSSSSSKNMKSNEQQQQQQHSTPPSHHSTLKYNDNGSKGYMALNQTIASNYSAAQPPSYCSTMMNDFETPLNYTVSYNSTSGTSNISNSGYHHHKMSPDYNNLNNLYSGSTNGAATSSSVANNTSNLHLGNELLENSDGFLDFDKTLMDGSSSSRRYCTDTDSDYNKYSKDQTNHLQSQHQSQQHHLYTGCDYPSNDSTVEYKNLANQIANTISNINSTLTRSRNRNHILTDNLPGPESCV
ncbi:uncharacterized protein side-III isoform X2 [Chironomus tepperi]|uniref:uncharacterized protein side-III isoform X2 n=1 Tax=Chironomus tepperi TaxID=113505 RepID=UPI00391F5BEC